MDGEPWCILFDRDESMWVGLIGGGIRRVPDLSQSHDLAPERFEPKDGLSGGLVYSSFEDREGNIWVGTVRGLDRFRENKVTSYCAEEGLITDQQIGLDMKSAAIRIHDLAKSLGVEKAEVVGHDIGLMVAYAYAAQFQSEVTKLVLMDAFLPGVSGWEAIYDSPNIWHFRFNGPTPEALVQGRERTYFDYFWDDFAADKSHSIPEADRKAYATAYARPGRMHAGWAYFVSFQQAAREFAELSRKVEHTRAVNRRRQVVGRGARRAS